MSERVGSFSNADKERLSQVGFKGTLQTPGGSVNLFTDFGDSNMGLLPNLVGLSGMVPGLVISEMKPGKSASLFLLEGDKKSLRFDENTSTVILAGNANDFIDGQAVLWTSYWLMEAQRQESSLFTLHSSALKIGDKGILLLGHSGAGKTTVMLDLCRKYNGQIVSNDLTIIGHESASGRLELINSKEQDPLFVERDEGISFLYRLYEDMSRIIKGSAISVFNREAEFLGYMPSLDTEGRHNRRVDCINQMVKRKGIISISGGNLDQVTETIYNYIKKS